MSDLPKTVVVERADLPHDTLAATPAGMADIRVEVLPAVQLVAIRALRTGLQTFVAALLGGAVGGSVVGISDLFPPSAASERLLAAVYFAAIAALISAAQNGAEILARWDVERPGLRG